MSPQHRKKAFHPKTSLLCSIGVTLLLSFGFALLSPQLASAVDITLSWNANGEADLDGYRIFYREDGGSYDYNNPDWEGIDTTCTISNLDDNTEYHFVARAFDTSGNESADSDEITYDPENVPPIADAGLDQQVDEGSTVTLDGSASSDPEGRALSYLWTQIGGPSVVLSDATDSQPTFTAPSVEVDETVNFELVVTDDGGFTNTDTVDVDIVNVNQAPIALAGPDQTVNAGDTVTLDGSNSSDPDGTIQAYSWNQTSGSSVTLSDSSAVNPTFTAPSAGQTLVFELTVTDNGGLTDTDTVSIIISSSSPNLTSLSISGSSSVNENTTANYTATATYSDNSTQTVTTSASWSENSSYSSISSSGVLTTSEVDEDETITITASFTSGAVTRSAQQVVTIVDVPEENLPPAAPVVSSPYDGQTEYDLLPTITTDAFSDPNDDQHGRTEWQISTQQDFSSDTVLDVNTDEHLTYLDVPHTVLEPETTYYLRVRFYDTFLEPSDWSSTVGFTTAVDNNDTNEDGIPDDQEVGYGVDIDENGTDDVAEPERIKTVQSVGTAMTIGVAIESPNVTSIDAVEIIDPSTISETINRPDNLTDVLSYRMSVSEVGATAQVTIYFSDAIQGWMSFYKYDTINGWEDYSAHTTFNGDGRSITLELMDGGYGDSDGEANGVIVDPGGLGGIISGAGSSVSSVGSAAASGSTGGGCFIAGAGYNLNAKHSTNTSSSLLLPVGLILIGCISRIWKKTKH
jgi:hypothetical protein